MGAVAVLYDHVSGAKLSSGDVGQLDVESILESAVQ